MARLLNLSRLPRHFLAMALFAASPYAPLLGQSSLATKTPTLEVLSVDYIPETDMIQFKLVNHGDRAATAYDVAFGLMNDAKHVNWGPGFGEDFLNPALSAQCWNAAQNMPADNSWEGAIKPGDTYVKTIPANLDKSQLNRSGIVHAEVAAIIWSDGSVEESSRFPWAIASIKSSRRLRERDANDTAKVVAILNAHPEDLDTQHRIGEAFKSLQALMADDSSVQPAPEGASIQKPSLRTSPVVGNVLSNLQGVAFSANPKEAFEAYRAFFECQNERRAALLQSAPPATSGQ